MLIPRAALGCIRYFRDLSGGRALCLIGDFGDTSEDDLRDHGPPGFGAGGGLWLAVNFRAICESTRGLGGHARQPADEHIRLNIAMLLFGLANIDAPETNRAYANVIDRHGPDDLAVVSRGLGAILYTLEQYADTLEFFRISLRDFGDNPRTTVNLALTLYRLGRLEECLEWLDRTLALDPDHELALRMRPDVAAELATVHSNLDDQIVDL